MVGMAVGGFLGGYLFDVSHGYTVSWLLSFGAGLISAFLAMDLLGQAERAKAEAETPPTPARSVQTTQASGV
jgi:MFS family permease